MIDDRSDVSDRRAFTNRSIVHRLALQIQSSIGQFPGEVPWQTFSNVFYLHHRYDRWNVSRSATGWKKRGDRFERCGNICGTRPTIIGTFPLTSRNGERGTHGAAQRDNQRDFSDTPKPSAFFLFRLQTVFPPHYTYIYIHIRCVFVSHLRLPRLEYFLKNFRIVESRSIN